MKEMEWKIVEEDILIKAKKETSHILILEMKKQD